MNGCEDQGACCVKDEHECVRPAASSPDRRATPADPRQIVYNRFQTTALSRRKTHKIGLDLKIFQIQDLRLFK